METILIIEDEKSILDNISQILEFEGYKSIKATNGIEGVKKAKTCLPDLIICDIMMPKMDGYEVKSKLSKDLTTATIPLIFLTARAGKQNIRKGMRMGAEDYITKPFSLEDLLESVEIRLEKKKLFDKKLENLRLNVGRAVPHDLRTPLTTILGFSKFLLDLDKENLPESKDMLETIQVIYNSGKKLQNSIERYLFYVDLKLSTISKEKQEKWIAHYPISMSKYIKKYSISTAKKYHRVDDLRFKLTDSELKIKEIVIQKIVTELVDNALKFSETDSEIRISSFSENHKYCITIEDNGFGMTDEQQSNIGAFMQFDRDKHEQQGTGLGFAIVKLLISIIDADLSIDSTVNEGTTIKLCF